MKYSCTCPEEEGREGAGRQKEKEDGGIRKDTRESFTDRYIHSSNNEHEEQIKGNIRTSCQA